ncbi:sigma factor-like helix-turn-helix DNA-binding protein [Haloglycomyces albus]|uniref:sigma factor-like helix-turn-helix DNA-binding protein n=1 Tax=Haloglycomyces albus TaxID=526067 RepID=UPI00046D0690|nr:sigma factor-like helix-turn-helix DNA-binding protein [Haloglycomyces albus]
MEMFSPVHKSLENLRSVESPLERAKLAHEAVEYLTDTVIPDLYLTRLSAVEALISGGMPQRQIAEELNVSRGRVSQMLRQGKEEKAFFGDGRITIAVGAKPESNRADSAQKFVISSQAMQAAQTLIDGMRSFGLDSVMEQVPPPGNVNLNRKNLLVMTSPRLLPFLGQVVASDPNIGFEERSEGWCLIDRESGQVYSAPGEASHQKDFAYIGRLPRPDGNGTFLYVAGIHSEGTLGGAQWLIDNVSSLYGRVKNRIFSTIVQVESNSETEEITQVQPVTKIFQRKS